MGFFVTDQAKVNEGFREDTEFRKLRRLRELEDESTLRRKAIPGAGFTEGRGPGIHPATAAAQKKTADALAAKQLALREVELSRRASLRDKGAKLKEQTVAQQAERAKNEALNAQLRGLPPVQFNNTTVPPLPLVDQSSTLSAPKQVINAASEGVTSAIKAGIRAFGSVERWRQALFRDDTPQSRKTLADLEAVLEADLERNGSGTVFKRYDNTTPTTAPAQYQEYYNDPEYTDPQYLGPASAIHGPAAVPSDLGTAQLAGPQNLGVAQAGAVPQDLAHNIVMTLESSLGKNLGKNVPGHTSSGVWGVTNGTATGHGIKGVYVAKNTSDAEKDKVGPSLLNHFLNKYPNDFARAIMGYHGGEGAANKWDGDLNNVESAVSKKLAPGVQKYIEDALELAAGAGMNVNPAPVAGLRTVDPAKSTASVEQGAPSAAAQAGVATAPAQQVAAAAPQQAAGIQEQSALPAFTNAELYQEQASIQQLDQRIDQLIRVGMKREADALIIPRNARVDKVMNLTQNRAIELFQFNNNPKMITDLLNAKDPSAQYSIHPRGDGQFDIANHGKIVGTTSKGAIIQSALATQSSANASALTAAEVARRGSAQEHAREKDVLVLGKMWDLKTKISGKKADSIIEAIKAENKYNTDVYLQQLKNFSAEKIARMNDGDQIAMPDGSGVLYRRGDEVFIAKETTTRLDGKDIRSFNVIGGGSFIPTGGVANTTAAQRGYGATLTGGS